MKTEVFMKGFKYKIVPTKEQKHLIHQTFGCKRLVYNLLLDEQLKVYHKVKEEKYFIKKFRKHRFSTPASFKKDKPFLKIVDSLALANAQMDVKDAFSRFFSKQNALPRFKSKKSARQSYTTNNIINKGNHSIRLSDDKKYIKLPKLGWVRIKMHRELPKNSLIKNVTVSRKNNRYYVSIAVQYEVDINDVEPESFFGLDFMMKGLFATSDGEIAEFQRFYQKHENKLKQEQRKLSRKVYGSKRWYKQKDRVNKIHEKIANKRNDLLHKLSYRLAEQHDVICIEDLNMKGMSQALKFGKSVHDNGWGKFTTYLEYKLKERGKYLIKIDKFFPSSKTCSSCNQVKTKLDLEERVFSCASCGFTMDRDINAAINIKNEGKRLFYEKSTKIA